MPAETPLPPIFLLGSSDYSAQLAAHIGAAFSFAHHFATFDAGTAMALYRDNFKAVAIAHEALCNSWNRDGVRGYGRRSRPHRHHGRSQHRAARQGRIPSARFPENASAYPYTPVDRTRIAQNRAKMSVGSPKTVRAKLEALIAETRADEVMVTTMVYGHEARKRSYELLAQAFNLGPSS